jgi:hypothetical protein
MKKFYRTTIVYEVLSEEPITSVESLENILFNASEGSYVGQEKARKEVKLTPKKTVSELYRFGSEPGFFRLDDNGKEAE